MAAVVLAEHNVSGWLPFHTTCVPGLEEFWLARNDLTPRMLRWDGPSYEITTLEEDRPTGIRPLDELVPDTFEQTLNTGALV
jgi:hypothetical protein